MSDPPYDLTLFVGGASDLSARAVANVRALCDAHLPGRYVLAVVDVHVDPAAAVRHRVVAAPALVRNLPLPVRRLVGDMSDATRVLMALELPLDVNVPAATG
jgi:circadian clock protein KaiB